VTEQQPPDILNKLYSEHLTEWSQRFTEACKDQKLDGIIVFSGVEKSRFRDDNKYPFYVEPYFRIWVPQIFPNSAIKIVPGHTPVLVQVQQTDFWHENPRNPDGFWTNHFDILSVPNTTKMLDELKISSSKLAVIGENADSSMGFSSINNQALLDHLDFYRAFKTDYEVACITEANRIAAIGHAATQRELTKKSKKKSEFQLNQIYCTATGQREFELPYQNIVALNEHASTLHYQNLNRNPPDNFLSLLLDAGATFNGYASDITRTISGENDQFDALIKSMDELQKKLCARTISDVSFIFLNELAHQLLANVLEEHELITTKAEESYDSGVTRFFLPHGLGHLLGLQVHDKGGYLNSPRGPSEKPPIDHPFLRLTRTLEPGFVVTIEPGLYFIPSLLDRLKSCSLSNLVNWAKVETLIPYGGIRIEDNILVTCSGSRNLSRPALKKSGVS
jgi:Xaa-Pro dipeptidase